MEASRIQSRDSKWELLRILCMLGIVGHHLVIHGRPESTGANALFLALFLPAGRLAVAVFVFMGAWFLADADFKTQRVLRLLLQVTVYVAAGNLAAGLIEQQETAQLAKSVLESLFAVVKSSYTFATNYIGLLLLAPFFNRMLAALSADAMLRLLLIATGMISVLPTVLPWDMPWSQEFLVFCLLYAWAYGLRHWGRQWMTQLRKGKPARALHWGTAALLIYLAICGFELLLQALFAWKPNLRDTALGGFQTRYSLNVSTLPLLICAVCIFFFFAGRRSFNSRLVNVIASGTFGCFLVHEHPRLRRILWEQMLGVAEWADGPLLVLQCLGAIAAVFSAGIVIDFVYQAVIGKPLLRLQPAKAFCTKLDLYFNRWEVTE